MALIDPDAERAALAVIAEEGRILGSEHALGTLEETGLTADDFADGVTRAFFVVMESALRKGQALVPQVFATDALKGFLPILQAQEVVSRAQLGTLAERLKELSMRRQAYESCRRLMQAAEDFGVTPPQLATRFTEAARGLNTRGSHWETHDAALDEAGDRIRANQDGTGTGAVKSGFPALDEVTGGYPPTLCVICGPGGVAKTALVLSSIRNMAMRGETAALFAMEDGKASVAFRWLAHEAEVSGFALKYAKLSDGAWNAVGQADGAVRGWPAKVLIDGRHGLRPNDVLLAAAEAVRRRGAKAVWLDNVTAMQWNRGPRMDLEIHDFLTGARALATEEGVPFVVVAHTRTRDGAKPGDLPRLSECRESPGAFENLSRMALGIGRNPETQFLECAVLKNTDGRTGIHLSLPFRANSAMLEDRPR